MTPKISIIIPIYNTEKYLAKCLESVLHQTFTNIEVILVDDKSIDRSVEIAQEFVNKDKRFKLFLHEKNLGPGAPRNTGIKIAKGEYIVFLDSDDYLTMDSCEMLYHHAVKTNSDFVIGRMHVLSNGKLTPVEYIETRLQNYALSPIVNLKDNEELNQFLGSPVNRIYRTAFLVENKITFPENLYWEDVAFSFEVWNQAKIVTVLPLIVYMRTIREDENNTSITQTYSMKSYLDRDKIVELMYKFCIKNYRKNLSILKKGVFAIKSFTDTTRQILPFATANIKPEADVWMVQHLKLVEKRIKHLENLHDWNRIRRI